MEKFFASTNETPVNEIHRHTPGKKTPGFFALSLRIRCILVGLLAATALTLLIALGSRGFHWFDAALIGYAVATTLIISLGLLTKPWQLVVLMLAVVLLTLQAIAINRLAGIPYPLWGPIKEGDAGGSKGSAK